MVSVIIPAAGRSTRFPNMKPKWLLTHPRGDLMVSACISGLDLEKVNKIYLTILREHLEKYANIEGIKKAFKNVGIQEKLEILVLNEPTRNQPHTVFETISKCNIKGPIYIKDVDNFYKSEIKLENSIAVYDLNLMKLVNPSNKSYVMINDDGYISNIVEKKVISSQFCVGGYSFEDTNIFVEFYKKNEFEENLYISHIIFNMILAGHGVKARAVEKYEDWGTKKEWDKYKSSFLTLFVDIDGVLIQNSGQYFKPLWGESGPIEENIEVLNELHDSGRVKIILTTARKEKDITIKQLQKNSIKYHDIIFNLPHGKRVIINDFAISNPYKSCEAVNISRNSNNLRELLYSAIRS